MKVYDHSIEVCLQPALEDAIQRNADSVRQLRPLRQKHDTVPEGLLFKDIGWTQEKALLDLLWQRACLSDKCAGEIGYLGSFHNCVFKLLYGIFGIDFLAYLFGRSWVPATVIPKFNAQLFLERLSVLEGATKKLKDGTKTPIVLPEATKYIRPGMGPQLKFFKEKEHRLLIESSLRELRSFGELGHSVGGANEKHRVYIQIWTPIGVDPHGDSEIMKFARSVG